MDEDSAELASDDGEANLTNASHCNELPEGIPEEDVLKILISTDNHIGYNEKCEVRGNDSLVTFEEVLVHAQKNDVDMILLG